MFTFIKMLLKKGLVIISDPQTQLKELKMIAPKNDWENTLKPPFDLSGFVPKASCT